jgi:hypothetical protein
LLTAWLLLSALFADDDKLTRLISTERIAAVHHQIVAHPHVAGTVGGRAQAELIAEILRGFGLKTETHSYWDLLSYPRRMTLRMFPNSVATQGVILSLNERSDARDPDTAAIDLLPGFIAYSATARVRGPIVDAGHGLPADYDALEKSGVSVKDKIALVRFGQALVSEKAQEAEKRGAVGVVFYNDRSDAAASKPSAPKPLRWPDGPARAAWFVERGAASRDLVPPRIPLAVVSWSVAEQILPAPSSASAFARPARKKPGAPSAATAELELEMHMNDSPRPIFNVISTIEGSEQPDRWVILGAHHDAWSSGGVDPGAPVAALLELARVLGAMSKSAWRPRHSIQLAFWDAGEYGNQGAAQHAQEFSQDLKEKLLAYVNCDLTAAGPMPVEGDFPPAPTMEMAFGARHSIYDTAAYMNRWYDPGFRKTRAAVEQFGRAALRLSEMDPPPPRPAPPPIVPKNEPARGEIEHAEVRLALAKEAYVAGAIAKKDLDAAQRDLDEAHERYERLREGSGQLTPAIAAEEVTKAEARLQASQQKLAYLEAMDSTGSVARRDLEQARDTVKESTEYLELARVRQQELAHEWELIRKVKEWEERGGRFDEGVLEKVSTAFEKQWGHPLPVSALGMTHTHEMLNFDHTGRVDVALSPDSPEGMWLVEQLTLHDVPFLVFRGAVAGKSTGAHIHLGLPSPRLHK